MPESKNWDPWKVYNVTEKELKAIKQRAKFRAAMKAEYQMKSTDPFYRRNLGYVFDPAVHRHMAMKVNAQNFFKPNLKTVCMGILCYVAPVAVLFYFGSKAIKQHDAKCGSGEIAYKDRAYKFQ